MTNKPAFPRPYSAGTFEAWSANDGMSMRQHYAGIIMAGLAANPGAGSMCQPGDGPCLAKIAVAFADALVEELTNS